MTEAGIRFGEDVNWDQALEFSGHYGSRMSQEIKVRIDLDYFGSVDAVKKRFVERLPFIDMPEAKKELIYLSINSGRSGESRFEVRMDEHNTDPKIRKGMIMMADYLLNFMRAENKLAQPRVVPAKRP